MGQKTIKNLFCPQKVEKTTIQSYSEFSIHFFSLTAWAAQTAQTEEFMFQNVAKRSTVSRTGDKILKKSAFK